MKKLSLTILAAVFMLTGLKVFAADQLESSYAQTAAKASVDYTSYKNCIRLYKLPSKKLFFLALSSVNANKFEILEMQSRNGYILFKAEGKEFLLDVLGKDKNYTYLKLTPGNNNYYFSPSIVQKIFNYIDVNFNAEVKELKF
ncbi:MAG: hypothetical protein KHX03_10205 [Clostridium sp.]|nr:hypothetical protein [Clostridium sp.]